mmetsp:Transcript_7887/g.24198  ORF Transcript_7887/g.24198 Transcript_7887/m.24198 type:complete len:268 (+) Transcript_7887:1072-1875(+)
MDARKARPAYSACARPLGVSTPPCLSTSSASIHRPRATGARGGRPSPSPALPSGSRPKEERGVICAPEELPPPSPSVFSRSLAWSLSDSGSWLHASGLIWTLRLMPEKWPPCSSTKHRCCSLRMGMSPPSPVSESESSPDMGACFSAMSSCTTSSSSCSCSGVLSLASPRLPPCRLSSRSSLGCRVVAFIFCLGVRSPWRITASTQRSSCRVLLIAAAGSSSPPSAPSTDDLCSAAAATICGYGRCVRQCGATAASIIARRMPAASS